MTTLKAWDKRLDRFNWDFEFAEPEERHLGKVGLAELEATSRTGRAFFLLFQAYRSARYYHTRTEAHITQVRHELHLPERTHHVV